MKGVFIAIAVLYELLIIIFGIMFFLGMIATIV